LLKKKKEMVFLVCFFIRLSWFYDSDYGFGELTQVDSVYFFMFFLIDFFSILFFNIELIEN